ncbi:hypothetical protein L873DRAFT_1872397 [Choiromyces venosus 120613-1]|uniref:Uncharacterized protein n=1 Tax=Choiromyces venosus 120613-1 TaxID=1336337 RepID=A0A3N4JB61_9PEZI|nr:hypothetical protein L873DRAFT_1872397 [Choiromyces venosus 120613-1]
MKFVCKMTREEDEDKGNEDDYGSNEGVAVMAEEWYQYFSELPPEFDAEEGLASQQQRQNGDEEVVKTPVGRHRECAKGHEQSKGKAKGKKVHVNVGMQGSPSEKEVLAVATDLDLGDVADFYTKGVICT